MSLLWPFEEEYFIVRVLLFMNPTLNGIKYQTLSLLVWWQKIVEDHVEGFSGDYWFKVFTPKKVKIFSAFRDVCVFNEMWHLVTFFLRILMSEVQTSLGIFEGKPGNLLFAYNQDALQQNKYYPAGSWLHGPFFTMDLKNVLINNRKKV